MDFRLPPTWKWDLCSFGSLRSVEWKFLTDVLDNGSVTSSWTARILKMSPIGCPETSERNYHSRLCKITKWRRSWKKKEIWICQHADQIHMKGTIYNYLTTLSITHIIYSRIIEFSVKRINTNPTLRQWNLDTKRKMQIQNHRNRSNFINPQNTSLVCTVLRLF
jgi:hypothetical protein